MMATPNLIDEINKEHFSCYLDSRKDEAFTTQAFLALS